MEESKGMDDVRRPWTTESVKQGSQRLKIARTGHAWVSTRSSVHILGCMFDIFVVLETVRTDLYLTILLAHGLLSFHWVALSGFSMRDFTFSYCIFFWTFWFFSLGNLHLSEVEVWGGMGELSLLKGKTLWFGCVLWKNIFSFQFNFYCFILS